MLSFSVPHGNSGGPVLYCAYASTISEIIPKSINLHIFTDDHAISDCFNPSIATSELNSNETRWLAWQCWLMDGFEQVENECEKSEVIYIGSRNQLDKCESKEFYVRNDLIPRSPVITYLGLWINELLTFQYHIKMKCKTAIWNLMKIQYLRWYLDQATCEILIHSLVMSHLDYVNIILFDATDKVISGLQRVQN